MIQIDEGGSERLSVRVRLVSAAAALCLLAPLTVAACLRPDPSGVGTHRQLGLPKCTFLWLFDTRCPSCGMTTSWAHAVRGRWLSAAKANAGGAVLAAAAMLAGPWLLISAVRGAWWTAAPDDRALAACATGIAAITLIDWICRLRGG